ncbi:MAG: hypothetical protein SPJ74_04150 [Bacilli bacterium]|nr:hypothetical protein [Bacilli bacterium]
MNKKYIERLYKEVEEQLDEEYKVVLEPSTNIKEDYVELDCINWELEDTMVELVDSLKNNNKLTLEEKVLEVYKFICLNYIYDDNVLFFFKKRKDAEGNTYYIAVDWYGRIIDKNWVEKRKTHNRRICYEFSRFFAKAINILIGNRDDIESFIIGLKDNTHYVTVISGEDYSAILDLDDFNKIKDLTRLKTGLTLDGIRILRDDKNILRNTIDKFNESRKQTLIEKGNIKEKIEYFNKAINTIKEYKLDSQGFNETMKKIIEDEKIDTDRLWKLEAESPEKRYVRCIGFEYESKKYIVDSVLQKMFCENDPDYDETSYIINPEEQFYEYYGG